MFSYSPSVPMLIYLMGSMFCLRISKTNFANYKHYKFSAYFLLFFVFYQMSYFIFLVSYFTMRFSLCSCTCPHNYLLAGSGRLLLLLYYYFSNKQRATNYTNRVSIPTRELLLLAERPLLCNSFTSFCCCTENSCHVIHL